MKEVEIESEVLEAIERMTIAADPLEVGGVLLGPLSYSTPRISSLIGPGPEARATPRSFEPDYSFQQMEMNRIYSESAGDIRYFGDWHSHPGGVCCPSATDLKTLSAIAESFEARCPEPVMLISALGASVAIRGFSLSEWQANELRLRIVD